jgi:hypothetical protein
VIDGAFLANERADRIEEIRQRVWNQNLASVVLVVDPELLTAYSVSNRTAEPDILTLADASRHQR